MITVKIENVMQEFDPLEENLIVESILNYDALSEGQKMILIAIIKSNLEQNVVSKKSLANMINYSRTYLHTTIITLESKGIISVTKPSVQGGYIFKINRQKLKEIIKSYKDRQKAKEFFKNIDKNTI